MATYNRFPDSGSDHINSVDIFFDCEKQRKQRQSEFSHDIGRRALLLIEEFGVDSKSYSIQCLAYGEVDTASTVTHSKTAEFSDGTAARVHVTRNSIGIWAPSSMRLIAGRLTRTGLGSIHEIQLDYTAENEQTDSVKLDRYQYGNAFPFTPYTQNSAYDQGAERIKDSFVELLETIEYKSFPR